MNTGPLPTLETARRHASEGRLEDAFTAYRTLLSTDTDRSLVRSEFGWFLFYHLPSKPHPAIDQALILALKDCWIRPETLAERVIRYLTAKWPDAFEGGANNASLQSLLADPLTITLLQATPAATAVFERILARFRRNALSTVLSGGSVRPVLAPLVALAIRGWHSGYALVLPQGEPDPEEEGRLVAQLADLLDTSGRTGPALMEAIAVLACYRTPTDAYLRPALAAGDQFARALHMRVNFRRDRQDEIAHGLKPVTSFDATSAIVAEQYEQHPYPAWVGIPAGRSDPPAAVLAALPLGGAPAISSVLIAGCGTGQTSLTAPQRWPNAEIIGLDLSRTSLAFAVDSAVEIGESRVTFVLGDLLRIGETGRRFQIIETTGVLHHLDDPEAGLAALNSVLEPGGLMFIALYSSRARRNLDAIRQQYGKTSAETDEEVRAFRAWALAHLDAPEVLNSPDFYSIGGCRDLIFHVREVAYTLPQISEMIGRAGLQLVELHTPVASHRLLPRVPAPTDLVGWDEVEQERPNIFGGMYGIWVKKPV